MRRLGQHFLVDGRVAKFMVDALAPGRDETVVEIGPGRGIITRLLAARAGRVVAIEKDRRLEPFLKGLPGNVEVVWGDALEGLPPCDRLISNVPFYISSKLLFSLPPVPAVLGLQREFAERMVAEPGSRRYGRLSVNSQLRYRIELLRSFPPEVFSPPPKVWLSVVRLEPREPGMWEGTEEVVRKLFSYPGRTVDNALKLAGFPPQGIKKRVRELSPREVVELSVKILSSGGKG